MDAEVGIGCLSRPWWPLSDRIGRVDKKAIEILTVGFQLK